MRWKDIDQFRLDPITFKSGGPVVLGLNIAFLAADELKYYRRCDVEPLIFGYTLGLRCLPKFKQSSSSAVESEVLRLYNEVYIVRSRWLSQYQSSSAVWFYQRNENGWKRIRLNKDIRKAMQQRLFAVTMIGEKEEDLPF